MSEENVGRGFIHGRLKQGGRSSLSGFTLVELLVVIGIIAVLVGILLPALSRVREQANATKCAANLKSIGQGFANYLAQNRGVYPAAYLYAVDPNRGAPHVAGGSAADPTIGYIHWSWFIFSSGNRSSQVAQSAVSEAAFTCPSINDEGGLPPTNAAIADALAGQQRDPDTQAGIVDQQVRRVAYTVNEAIIPRNKFSPAIARAGTATSFKNQYVTASRIKESANVILATEFHPDWRVISEDAAGDSGVVKSHRPVHAYQAVTGGVSINLTDLEPDAFGRPIFRAATAPPADVRADSAIGLNRLSWVGRNHGRDRKTAKTNFLFVDGHVETKRIEETLKPFQWGKKIYSLRGEPSVLID